MLTPNCSRTQCWVFFFLKQAKSVGVYTTASGTVVKTTTAINSSALPLCVCMQSLAMVLHFCNSFTYECPRKHVWARASGAAGLSGSFLTFRKENQRTCRHCPGVSQHMTPYPVCNNLTIPSSYHIISRIKRKSISLTCGTLDFPTKYSWNLKTSLRDGFMQVTQEKSQVFGLNKMLKLSSYASVTSQDWQGASASAGATSSSDGVLCTPHGSQ